MPYIFIIFKLIRYPRSFRLIGNVLGAVREELVTAYTACGIMVCFSAILMYYIERNAQPEAFENIGDGHDCHTYGYHQLVVHQHHAEEE